MVRERVTVVGQQVGIPRVAEVAERLGIGPDETTEDLKFTVKTVNCVGACAMAPVLIVGDKYWGSAKSARMAKYLAEGGDDEN